MKKLKTNFIILLSKILFFANAVNHPDIISVNENSNNDQISLKKQLKIMDKNISIIEIIKELLYQKNGLLQQMKKILKEEYIFKSIKIIIRPYIWKKLNFLDIFFI